MSRKLSWRAIALLLLGLAYLVFPLDVIPDIIPILGQTDDAVVMIVSWIVSLVLAKDKS